MKTGLFEEQKSRFDQKNNERSAKRKKMKDSKTHWFGLKFSTVLWPKSLKRPKFACKRKRAAAKSRGLAQKIEHCSIGAN